MFVGDFTLAVSLELSFPGVYFGGYLSSRVNAEGSVELMSSSPSIAPVQKLVFV